MLLNSYNVKQSGWQIHLKMEENSLWTNNILKLSVLLMLSDIECNETVKNFIGIDCRIVSPVNDFTSSFVKFTILKTNAVDD